MLGSGILFLCLFGRGEGDKSRNVDRKKNTGQMKTENSSTGFELGVSGGNKHNPHKRHWLFTAELEKHLCKRAGKRPGSTRFQKVH